MAHVIVVGGGIIGAACAYHLSRTGWKVTILDRGEFGQGCSHANCGFVSPSHVLPIAVPGAVRMALKSMFSPSSAFRIKPRLDWSLIRWLWSFYRRCNTTDMMRSATAIQALLNSSRALYDEWIRDEAIECEWQTRGLLFVLNTDEGMHHYAETDALLTNSFQRPAKRIGGRELESLEPALKPGLAGAFLYESDAHLRPDRLMSSVHKLLQNRGVEVVENTEVLDVARSRGRVDSLATTRGNQSADAFLFATGAWTPLLSKQLGCRIPIQPGKGYSITMARPKVCPAYPLIFEEHHVAITPMKSGYRIGSTMEFAGYDASLNRKRLDLLKNGAAHYLREPFGETVEEVWYGWRPMTPDSTPIIGRWPKLDNVWIAAGHNMLGLSMAPATGKLVAELLNGSPPHLDPEPYSPRRFA